MASRRFGMLGLAIVALAGASYSAPAANADWPQWRGPNRDGISTETGLLQSWPEGGPPRVWMFEECGQGYSGPAIVGDRLYIMGTRGDKEVLFALDVHTGKEQWFAPVGDIYKENHGDGPRCSPSVDGNFVYGIGAKGNLVCVEAATGKVVWSKSMNELGGREPHWGYSESPFIYKDTVLCTPGGKNGSIVAFDKRTGDVAWQSTEITSNAHYASIVPMPNEGRDEAVQLLPDQVAGFDPATGKLLWTVPWVKPVAAIPTPVVHDRFVYITSGYGSGCMLVEVGPGHKAEKVYDNKIMKNKQGNVLLVGDNLFGHSEGVGWVCQDFMTGEQKWRDREVMEMGAVAYADGRFYCLGEGKGEVALVEPSNEKWEERGRFKPEPASDMRQDDARFWTIPVICGGHLFLRDQNLVYCYDVRNSSLAKAGRVEEK